MTQNPKNRQNLHVMLEQLKQRFPLRRFRASQRTEETTAKGWGFNVKRSTSVTVFEPVGEQGDERE